MDESRLPLKRLVKGIIVKNRFPRESRVRHKSDFQRIQTGAKRVYSRHFVILLAESRQPASRVGLAVSKRVDKRAVRRNLLKRRLREIFRLNRDRFVRPLDLVIIARSGAADISAQEVGAEILRCLQNKGFLAK